MATNDSAAGPRASISYSREDLEFVLWLSTSLRGLGHEVWIGHERIVAGRNTVNAIHNALDQADVMLLVITPEALQSRLVNSQWTYFYCECEKPLIPLIRRPLGPDDKLNFMLAYLQSVDFLNDYEQSDATQMALARLHCTLLETYRNLTAGNSEVPSSFLTPLNPIDELSTREAGILRVHHSMPTDTFIDWVRQAVGSVRIMNTWTGLLARQPQLFFKSLERGCEVQILLLSPSSPFARQRDRNLNLGATSRDANEQEVPRNIQTTIRQLADLFQLVEDLPGQLDLRLYDLLPSLSMHQCDTRALIGFYPHSARTTTFPMLEVQTNSALGRRFNHEFEAIWNHAMIVDLAPRGLLARADDDLSFNETLSTRELEIMGLIEAGLSIRTSRTLGRDAGNP